MCTLKKPSLKALLHITVPRESAENTDFSWVFRLDNPSYIIMPVQHQDIINPNTVSLTYHTINSQVAQHRNKCIHDSLDEIRNISHVLGKR